jgi:hypothetical protein
MSIKNAKNVTPSRGAQTKTAAKKQESYKPRFRSDKPKPRSAGGRGNERVTNDDVARVAEHSLTPEAQEDRWARVPNAIEYLRRYNEYLEVLARNEAKKEGKGLTPMSALRLMDTVFRHKELLSNHVKSPLEKIYDILRFTVVPEVFADNEITTLTLEGIGRCNVLDDIAVSIVGENKDEKEVHKKAFYEWLVANELEDLITQTVNAQTLAAFVRRQIQSKDGLKLPMNHLEVKPVTRAQITRS